jgi:hypothetical protein
MKPQPRCTTIMSVLRLIYDKGVTYEKAKKRAEGMTIKVPVAMFTGRSRVFWRRPPQQKAVLPEKY